MVREHFAHVLGHDHAWESAAQRVAQRTYEFVEFLTKVLQVNLSEFSLPAPAAFTFHYTCHLRGLGMSDEPVKLLRQINGVEFRPMENIDQCCGFGGTFAIKYPAISHAMVEDKVRSIERTQADVTICNDAGCTMNIAGMCHRRGVAMRFAHAAEIIAEALGLDLASW